ncbi:MAG: hypothetical protein WC619_05165, partial [Patescibacteria group bacterium]
KLSVAGNIAVDGTITASGFTATSSISAPYFTATGAAATSTFAGGFSFGKNLAFTNTATSSVTMANGLNFDNGTFVIDPNSGRVGIGTATPNNLLTLATATSDNALSFTTNNTSRFTMGVDYSDSNKFKIETSSTLGGATPAFVINSGGQVGIGTTTPNQKLSIFNSAADSAIEFSSASGPKYKWTMGLDYTDGSFRIASSTALGSSDRFVINGAGNVGIGTTSPFAKLSVGQNAGETGFSVGSSTATNFIVDKNGNVGIGTAGPSATLEVSKAGGSELVALNLFNTQGNANQLTTLKIGNNEWISSAIKSKLYSGGNDTDLSFWTTETGSITQKMVITNIGNVGIGTTSPAYLLDVDGDFRVGVEGSATDFTLYANTTTGKVGIGTSSPMSKLSVTANSGAQLTLAYDETNYANFTVGSDSQLTIAPANSATTTIGVGDEALRVDSSGNVGIGTTTAKSKLSVRGGVDINRGVVVAVGNIDISGSYKTNGADYAEYFYTIDSDLVAGEAVCVDVARPNAVKRCDRVADDNLMGIVSTKPAIVGNGGPGENGIEKSLNNHYAIIGMLGQVPARATTANGEIRPGDSLTSASRPGYVMKAGAGDSTVGVALEGLTGDETSINTGVINVLISRRNKSLTVEEVESKVTERIANMEIEDEVNLLISNAIDNLNLNDEITEAVDPKLLLLETKLTVKSDDLTSRIVKVEADIKTIAESLVNIDSKINNFQLSISNFQTIFNSQFSNLDRGLAFNENGNIKLGNGISTSTPAVAVVEIVTAPDTNQTAFVINQAGSGDIADFRANDVSILNIGNNGKVSIVGTLLVDGRIMACSGGACGAALEAAVDETAGDIGVEGKVVAGAFEGYCGDGFVWVTGSAKYGTLPGFCVAEKKTRNDINEIIANVSQGEAQLACQALGTGYHLISENEWLTIAENIIKLGANDTDEDVLGLQLATGLPAQAGEIASTTAYTLVNGNMVYELAGQAGEWTNETITGKGCPELSGDGWQEYYNVLDYKGLAIAPPYYLNNADNNIGKIKIGSSEETLRGFVRGVGGIYSLDLSYAPTAAGENIGFRCAK